MLNEKDKNSILTILNTLKYAKEDILALIHILENHKEIKLDDLEKQIPSLSKGDILQALLALELTSRGQILLYVFHGCSVEPQILIPYSMNYFLTQTLLCKHCGESLETEHVNCEIRFSVK
jgi:hypothetical protein